MNILYKVIGFSDMFRDFSEPGEIEENKMKVARSKWSDNIRLNLNYLEFGALLFEVIISIKFPFNAWLLNF